MTSRTLFEKVWDPHVVRAETPDHPAVLYIDLHLVHEVTSPQAFAELKKRGIPVRRPDRTLATLDHSIPTKLDKSGALDFVDEAARAQVALLEENCRQFGVPCLGLEGEARGVVHVVGPERGRTQPGYTIVCGDSHTSTHGAFGALAFGVGTSEVSHVLATQCLLQRRPKTFSITVDGRLAPGVGAKDLILFILSCIGTAGGTGHVLEYRGSAIRALTMEQRMTLCNMSIEGGARSGMVAPDDVTFEYLAGRAGSPKGADWDAALKEWKDLKSDEGALFDRDLSLDGSAVGPMITWGTNPGQAIPVDAPVPESDGRALQYMNVEPGKPLLGRKVDAVFIGSCTNGRITDLREAAPVFEGRKVAVRTLVVPGSFEVKRQAEAEGLADIFRAAGAEWREPGCSMCIAMNGDMLEPGQVSVSTSNRNFEGRQGPGGRTHLAGPATAAASAVSGVIADPRELNS